MATHGIVNKALWLLVTAVTLFSNAGAFGCECNDDGSLDSALKNNAYVFRAVVIGAEVVREGEAFNTEIALSEIIPYKGGVPPFKSLFSRDENSCGLRVQVPQDYWFFVDKFGEVNRCSRTSPAHSDRVKVLEDSVLLELVSRRESGRAPFGYENVLRRPSFSYIAIPILFSVSIVFLVVMACRKKGLNRSFPGVNQEASVSSVVPAFALPKSVGCCANEQLNGGRISRGSGLVNSDDLTAMQ